MRLGAFAAVVVAVLFESASACKDQESPPIPGTPTNPTNAVFDAGALSRALDPAPTDARATRRTSTAILTDAGELFDGEVDAPVQIDSGATRTR
jgi:hypothetical protein